MDCNIEVPGRCHRCCACRVKRHAQAQKVSRVVRGRFAPKDLSVAAIKRIIAADLAAKRAIGGRWKRS